MRTFLIPPSFMAALAAVLLAVGWLTSLPSELASPNLGAMPPIASYVNWHRNMATDKPATDPGAEILRERAEELQFN